MHHSALWRPLRRANKQIAKNTAGWRVLRIILLIGAISLPTFVLVGPDWVNAEAIDIREQQRAYKRACDVAGAAVLGRTTAHSIVLADDCSDPIVTEVVNEPGFVIITRLIESRAHGERDASQAYSILLYGRKSDEWHIVGVKLAPNLLVLDEENAPKDAKGHSAWVGSSVSDKI